MLLLVHVHGIMICVRMELACKHKMPPHPSPVVPDRNRTAAERQSLPREGKVPNAVRRMRWNANQHHSSTVKAKAHHPQANPAASSRKHKTKRKGRATLGCTTFILVHSQGLEPWAR